MHHDTAGIHILTAATFLCVAAPCVAQPSSLYAAGPTAPPPAAAAEAAPAAVTPRDLASVLDAPLSRSVRQSRARSLLNPNIAAASLLAVPIPEPAEYSLHDLVTIIVRETSTTDIDSSLETQRKTGFEGEITDFPKFQLGDLMNFRLRPNNFPLGNPKLGVKYDHDWEGEGQYRRRETMTTRLQARIIDIKPNGTIVLESRKFIQTDNEAALLIVTGTCRVDDIAADNTVLSTQLHDLHVNKQHGGEVRKAIKKGVITKLLEGIFNF